jgi:DNA-directed RNA polymerase subunit RPC12/RpoP
MPFKSEAQRRLFHHLVRQGKLAPEVAHEYEMETKKQHKRLPEYVSKKAFGGEVHAKKGVRCPACDYPLDAIPVAMDAGEACPRCGYGSAKDVPQMARGGEVHYGMPKSHSGHGGEVMDSTAYRARGGEMGYARGGEMQCAHCGSVTFVPLKASGGEVPGLYGDMKELYPRKRERGADLDDGKIHDFSHALKRRRR